MIRTFYFAVALLLPIFVCAVGNAEEAPVIGTITAIQEVSPLRLTVATALGNRKVRLTTKTVVQDGKKTIEPGALRNDQHVIIAGKLVADSFVAEQIEIAELVQGKIIAIMEIFPLRLSVKTKDATVSVQLTEQTRILRKRKAIGMGQLRNGDHVRIIGTKRGKTARVTAGEIVVARD